MSKKFNLQKLKYERLSRNKTVGDLSNALSISATAYYRKESGATNISVEELPLILDELGIERSDAGRFYVFD